MCTNQMGHVRVEQFGDDALVDLIQRGLAALGARVLDRLVATDGKRLDRRQLREHVDSWTSTHDPDALVQRERWSWAARRLSVTADAASRNAKPTRSCNWRSAAWTPASCHK
jgi:hypothetical protein